MVVITSNRTREIHDALKRRCLYYWIEFPDFDKEMQIVRSKVPAASQNLSEQVTAFVQSCGERSCTRCRVSQRPSTGRRRW